MFLNLKCFQIVYFSKSEVKSYFLNFSSFRFHRSPFSTNPFKRNWEFHMPKIKPKVALKAQTVLNMLLLKFSDLQGALAA